MIKCAAIVLGLRSHEIPERIKRRRRVTQASDSGRAEIRSWVPDDR